MLVHTYSDGNPWNGTDETYTSAHNITEAKAQFEKLLKPGEKPIELYEIVKHKGLVRKEF